MAGSALRALVFALITAQTGTFAYYGLQQHITARLTRAGNNRLDLLQILTTTRKPVTHYVSVAGGPVHVLLVRDDFNTFAHVHPQVRKDGHFSVPIALDANHRYYAYVDSFVAGIGEQALRFTVQNGAPPHHLDVTLERPNRTSRSGSYTIALSTARFAANAPVSLSTTVRRGAAIITPVKTQFAYVASLVNTKSLEYVSIHGDGLQLRLPRLPRGVYRMWLELSINGIRYTFPFTLVGQ